MSNTEILRGLSVDLSNVEAMTSPKHCGTVPNDLAPSIPKFKVVCEEGTVGRFIMLSKETVKLVIDEVEIQVRTQGE